MYLRQFLTMFHILFNFFVKTGVFKNVILISSSNISTTPTSKKIVQELNVRGLVPSVFTPFNENGQVNVCVIPEYAKYLKDRNIDGILVAGTMGEGPALSLTERKVILDAWVREARCLDMKVVMHVGGMPLPDVLEMASYAETLCPAAILTLPELYYRPANVEALVRYVKLVSDAAPSLPILYYDHPSYSGVKLNMAKFFSLATKFIPKFKGMKCSFITAVEVLTNSQVNKDQRIFMASHMTTAAAYMTGINASMTATTNLFPGMTRQIERAVQQHDLNRARELQKELNRRVAVITEQGGYVPLMKSAMQFISGIELGSTRPPLSCLSQDQKRNQQCKILEMNLSCT